LWWVRITYAAMSAQVVDLDPTYVTFTY